MAPDPDPDPDARWRDPRQYEPGAEVLFLRHGGAAFLDGHVRAIVRDTAAGRRPACDAARARRLYDAWVAPRASDEGLADACHGAFLGALGSSVQTAVDANFDARGAAFAEARDALLALLRAFAALDERPLGGRPDFTRHIAARLAGPESSSTHLAAAILLEAGFVPHLGPAVAADPVFERIRERYFTAAPVGKWQTAEARHLFQSASYYIVHGGPRCRQQILAGMSGEAPGAAAAYRRRLHQALETYIWEEGNHKLRAHGEQARVDPVEPRLCRRKGNAPVTQIRRGEAPST